LVRCVSLSPRKVLFGKEPPNKKEKLGHEIKAWLPPRRDLPFKLFIHARSIRSLDAIEGKLRHSTGKRKETPTLDIVVVLATIISGHQSTEVLVAPKTYAAFKRRRLNFHVSPDHNSPVSN
jgi:hypothetical protein